MKPPLNISERIARSSGRVHRTKRVCAAFSEEEYKFIRERARDADLKVGEWVRDVLLEQPKVIEPSPMAIFTELVALRAVVDKFLGPVAVGQKLTKELAQQIVAEIKEAKHDAAKAALEQYINPLGDKG